MGECFILVTGGKSPEFGPWIIAVPRESGYNPAQQTPIAEGEWGWSVLPTTGPAPPPLIQHTATIFYWQERLTLLVLGGRDPFDNDTFATAGQPLRGWLLDIDSTVWTPLPKFKGTFPLDRYGHTATLIDPNFLIVMGGINAVEDLYIYVLDFKDMVCSAVEHVFQTPAWFDFPNKEGAPSFPICPRALCATTTVPPSAAEMERIKAKERKERKQPEGTFPRSIFMLCQVDRHLRLHQLNLTFFNWDQIESAGTAKVVHPSTDFPIAPIPVSDNEYDIDFVAVHGGQCNAGCASHRQATFPDLGYNIPFLEEKPMVSCISIQHPRLGASSLFWTLPYLLDGRAGYWLSGRNM